MLLHHALGAVFGLSLNTGAPDAVEQGKGIDICYSARLYLRILCNQLAHFTGEERLIK